MYANGVYIIFYLIRLLCFDLIRHKYTAEKIVDNRVFVSMIGVHRGVWLNSLVSELFSFGMPVIRFRKPNNNIACIKERSGFFFRKKLRRKNFSFPSKEQSACLDSVSPAMATCANSTSTVRNCFLFFHTASDEPCAYIFLQFCSTGKIAS